MLLSDQVMIITGAGPGVGRSLALAAAREGAAVVVAARSEKRIADIVQAVTDQGGRALGASADVTDAASCEALASAAVERFGRIDALVNCAFWTEPEQSLQDTAEATWLRGLDVNLVGSWRVLNAVTPHLTRPGGSVVLIGSQAGAKPSRTLAVYAAAKSALQSLVRSAALQLGPDGIRVNSVLPGSIDGPGLRDWAVERAEQLGTSLEEELGDRVRKSPLSRIVTPDEIAEAVVFLCSARASGITGSALDLDCGQHLTA
jgi:NAD(P)-dependent dehydrogenase (short-subunit alcohol dehydrogenase family)